jgi:hypothetical protein
VFSLSYKKRKKTYFTLVFNKSVWLCVVTL